MPKTLANIDIARAAELMKAGALMVDVRETYEFANAHIPGSINVALSSLEASDLPREKGRPIVFFCASGGRTAVQAGRLAAKAAGAEAYVMSGGMVGWTRAGLPVETGAQAGSPRGGFFSRLFG